MSITCLRSRSFLFSHQKRFQSRSVVNISRIRRCTRRLSEVDLGELTRNISISMIVSLTFDCKHAANFYYKGTSASHHISVYIKLAMKSGVFLIVMVSIGLVIVELTIKTSNKDVTLSKLLDCRISRYRDQALRAPT